MPVLKMVEKVYLNGSIIPRDEAAISPLDFGFLYGYGLYETTRAYQGKPFYFKEHLERLRVAARLVGLEPDIAAIEAGALQVIKQNDYHNARLRIVVSYGEGNLRELLAQSRPSVLITAENYQPPTGSIYENGFKAIYSSLHRQSDSTLAAVKSTSFLEKLLAKREAQQAGADDALVLNDKGFLAEASTSNLFIVEEGRVLTPPPSASILPGITRRLVLKLVQQQNLVGLEEDITPARLEGAEEAFITNSMVEIMPLTKVTGKQIGTGRCGSITNQLAQAYKELVKRTLFAKT